MKKLRERDDGVGNKINDSFKKELNSMLKLLETRFKHLEDVSQLLQKKDKIRDD